MKRGIPVFHRKYNQKFLVIYDYVLKNIVFIEFFYFGLYCLMSSRLYAAISESSVWMWRAVSAAVATKEVS